MNQPAALQTATPARIEYIDIAKCLALILIVLSHSVYPTYMSWSRLFYVPIFFFCSGFTTRKVDIARKARTLLVPYVTFNAILLLFTLAIAPGDVNLKSTLGFFYGRFCLRPLGSPDNMLLLDWYNTPCWFLLSLFTSLVLSKPLLESRSDIRASAIAAGYLAAAWLMNQLPVLLPWSLDTAPYFAIVIWCGHLARKHNIFEKPMWIFILLMIASLAVRVTIKGFNLSVRDYGYSITVSLIDAIAGSAAFIRLIMPLDGTRAGRFFFRLNSQALSIFCLHTPFLVLVLMLFPSSAPIKPLVALVQAIAAMAGGYAIGLMLQRYIPWALGKKPLTR